MSTSLARQRHHNAIAILAEDATVADLLEQGITLAEIAGVTAASLMLNLASGDWSDKAPPKDAAALLRALHPYTQGTGATHAAAQIDITKLTASLVTYAEKDR